MIIGLDDVSFVPTRKRLYLYDDFNGDPIETTHSTISPYLVDGDKLSDPHVVVSSSRDPINGMPQLKTGVQMIDNGILTFTAEQYSDFVDTEPLSNKYFRKYIGGEEFIHGYHRWILYLADVSMSDLHHMPEVVKRIRLVREYRASSSRKSTVELAQFPTRIGVDERFSEPVLVIPNTSSERREYVPMGWINPDIVANQKLRIFPSATLSHFALLTSAMHMAWMRTVTGRLESRYSYSVGVVYNAFPTPPGFLQGGLDLSTVEPLAQAVLDARSQYPDSTLATLYDPDLMPPNLRKAHQALRIAP